MRFKDNSVNPAGMTPGLLLGCVVADGVYNEHGHELVVTSLNDGAHSLTSLHYSGNAADFRTKAAGIPLGEAQEIAADIKGRLGIHYDVIAESDHIHLEYQPRRPE